MWSTIWTRLSTRFGPDIIAKNIAELLPNIISAILTFLIFWVIWKVLSKAFNSFSKRITIDRTLESFIRTALRLIIFIVATIAALGELGINTLSLMTSLGVAGLTLGFAAKDTLSNLISGLFIFWDRPFVLGDLIEISGQYGKVDQITLRSTRIVTTDGKMIAIPNGTIVNSMVASYTNFPSIRIEINVTLGVEEDLQRARQIFTDLVQNDERFQDTPAPQMVVSALNDFNVAVQFRAWLIDEHQHIAVRFELRERIFEALRTAGVDMPFETFEVRTPPPTPPISEVA